MTSPVLQLSEAVVRRARTTLVGPVTWTVEPGQRWAVVGPNGSGKTTLIRLAAATLIPTAGVVEILGRRVGRVDARTLKPRIGLASAAIASAIPEHLVPLDVVVAARDGALVPWWSRPAASDVDRAAGLLRQLGVPTVDGRSIGTLSSGERQRVAIARALMPDPDLLLLDEPAAGLDLGGREELVDRLAELAASTRPSAIVLVTHHVEEIPRGFAHALVLSGGHAVAAGPIEGSLTSASLSAAFGMPLEVFMEDGRHAARRARAAATAP